MSIVAKRRSLSKGGRKPQGKGSEKREQFRKIHRERWLASIPAGQMVTGLFRTLYAANGWRIYLSDNRAHLDHHDSLSHSFREMAAVSWRSMELYEVPFDECDPDTDWTQEVRFIDPTSPAYLIVVVSRGEYKWTMAGVELVRNGMSTYAMCRFVIPDVIGDALLALFVPALTKGKKAKATKAA